MFGYGRKSQLGYAIYNRSIANRPLGERLDFGSRGHPIDSDKPSDDDVLTCEELRGNLLTIGWNNHQMTSSVVVDMNGDETTEDGEGNLGEVRGVYARFCALNEPEQTMYMYLLTKYICALIGVSVCDWEPSDEFVLTAIELELSDDDLRRAARSAYAEYLRSTDSPFEGVGHDSTESEAGDSIGVSQQSTRGGLPNIGRRFSNVSYWLSESDRRKGSPSQVGEANSRRQTCTRRARREAMRKDSEHYFGFAGKGDGFEQYVDTLEALMVEADHRERFEREVEGLGWSDYFHPQFSSDALNEALEEMQNLRHFGFRFSDRDLSCDVAGLPGYRPEDSRRRIAERDAWLNEQRTMALRYYRTPSTPQHRSVPTHIDADSAYFGQSSGKRSAYRRRVSPKELDLSL